MSLRKLWRRYDPRRKYIDMDDNTISLMAQLGYIELYRGEWFFTDLGHEALEEGIRIFKKENNVS